MNEFASDGVRYVPRLALGADIQQWASYGAMIVSELIARSAIDSEQQEAEASIWAHRFDASKSIDAYLEIYRKVFDECMQ